MAGRSGEDPLAMARRHVAEAEARVVRQEALLARLSQDSRHVRSAAAARVVLDTLRYSLRLAREHLSVELSK